MRTYTDGSFVMIAAIIAAIFILNTTDGRSKTSQDSSHSTGIIELFLGIPDEVISEALASGGLDVALYGTPTERHAFAKGYATRFGKMSFSADDYLKYNKGWSEEKIHSVGHSVGFSSLWGKPQARR